MKGAYKKKPGRGAAGFVLRGIAVLLAAAVFVFQVPSCSSLITIPRVSASGRDDGPCIIGGFVPENPYGIPEPQDNREFQDPEEPFFLSWNFINGLFLGILVLEFFIFPFLFWMWFGPNGSGGNDLAGNAVLEPKKLKNEK